MLFRSRRVDDGSITNAVTTAAAVQYSDEYKFDVGKAAFTGFVERYGRLLEPEENFWKQIKNDTRERYELTQWLLLFAVLWFVMDIALRRFHFLPQDMKLYRALIRKEEKGVPGKKEKAVPGKEGIPDSFNGEAESQEQQEQKVSKKKEKAAESGSEGKRQSRRKAAAQDAQVLDTSALLKKKDQRNQ